MWGAPESLDEKPGFAKTCEIMHLLGKWGQLSHMARWRLFWLTTCVSRLESVTCETRTSTLPTTAVCSPLIVCLVMYGARWCVLLWRRGMDYRSLRTNECWQPLQTFQAFPWARQRWDYRLLFPSEPLFWLGSVPHGVWCVGSSVCMPMGNTRTVYNYAAEHSRVSKNNRAYRLRGKFASSRPSGSCWSSTLATGPQALLVSSAETFLTVCYAKNEITFVMRLSCASDSR